MVETPADYNIRIIREFRANGGQVVGMWEGTPLLLLHHTCAKSGMSRVNPVAYLPDDAGYFIWAANGGAPKSPAWYQNLEAQRITRIEVGGEAIEVKAKEATGDERDRPDEALLAPPESWSEDVPVGLAEGLDLRHET